MDDLEIEDPRVSEVVDNPSKNVTTDLRDHLATNNEDGYLNPLSDAKRHQNSDLSRILKSHTASQLHLVDTVFKSTKRYQIDFRCLVGSIIGLEGLIGAGKTTAGRSMVNFLNENGIKAKFFKEFVNPRLLKQYISDMKKYSYTFQLIMGMKRLEIYHKASEYAKTGGIAIIDRTLLGDMTFALMQYHNGNYTEEEWDTYNDIIKTGTSLAPSLVVYFKTSSAKAYERMVSRGYKSEKDGYTIDYFRTLCARYDEVMERAKKTYCILDLDWNKDKNVIGGSIEDEDTIKILYDIRGQIISV